MESKIARSRKETEALAMIEAVRACLSPRAKAVLRWMALAEEQDDWEAAEIAGEHARSSYFVGERRVSSKVVDELLYACLLTRHSSRTDLLDRYGLNSDGRALAKGKSPADLVSLAP